MNTRRTVVAGDQGGCRRKASRRTGEVMRRLGGCVLAACAVAGLLTAHTTPAVAASSRRSTTLSVITCTKNTTWLTIAGEPRQVHWQTPLGTPPAGGWPTAFLFQGSLFSGELDWVGYPGM